MNKHEYAKAAIKETAAYDGYTDHIEPVDVKLPGTKLGAEARAKAILEDRVMTNKQARLAGKIPLMHGEQKSKDHLEKMLARFSTKK